MKAGPDASFYTLQIDRFQKSNPVYSVSGKMEEEEESFSVREAKKDGSMLKELRKSANRTDPIRAAQSRIICLTSFREHPMKKREKQRSKR